jgi:hypothetical protein
VILYTVPPRICFNFIFNLSFINLHGDWGKNDPKTKVIESEVVNGIGPTGQGSGYGPGAAVGPAEVIPVAAANSFCFHFLTFLLSSGETIRKSRLTYSGRRCVRRGCGLIWPFACVQEC